jgi:hypothetical protein
MGIALTAAVVILIIIIAAVYYSQQRAARGPTMDDNTGEMHREDAFGYVEEIEEAADAGPEGDDNRLDR